MSNVDNEGLRSLDEVRAQRSQRWQEMAQIASSEQEAPARAYQPGGIFSRLNPGEIEEIEARVKAATEGPWTILAGHTGIRGSLPYAWVGPQRKPDPSVQGAPYAVAPVVERSNFGTMADMRFIAHARKDVPKLIETIHALSRRIAKRFNETAQARQDAATMRERAESAESDVAEYLRSQLKDAQIIDQLRTQLRDAAYRIKRAEDALASDAREIRRLTRANRDLDQQLADVSASARRERELTQQAREELEKARKVADVHRARVVELELKKDEYGKDAMERTQAIDKIRQRFGIEPGEDLFEGLCRKVGELQTSEAELVSKPLEGRIRQLQGELGDRLQSLEKARAVREGLESEMRTCQNQLNMIMDLVSTDEVSKALEEIGDRPTQYPHLAGVVKAIREVVKPEPEFADDCLRTASEVRARSAGGRDHCGHCGYPASAHPGPVKSDE